MLFVNRLRSVAAAAAVAALGGLAGATSASADAAPEFGFEPGSVTAQFANVSDMTASGETLTEVHQAGARFDAMVINFGVTRGPGAFAEEPLGAPKDVDIELPVGLVGNPEATPKCTFAQLDDNLCPTAAQVGFHELYKNAGRGLSTDRDPIYNMVPPPGVPARFAMRIASVVVVTFDMHVNSDGRYNIVTRIRNMSQIHMLLNSRAYIFGTPANLNGPGTWRGSGRGTATNAPKIPLLTLPTECGPPQPVKFRMRSWQNPEKWIEESYTPAQGISGCEKLSFSPRLDLRSNNLLAAAPSGLTVRVDVPQYNAVTALATPALRKVEVDMPPGVAINPSSVHGLVGCTDAQVALRRTDDPTCPAASRIGSVKIDTPVLAGPLEGGVFLGTPKSNDSQTGEMFRVFLVAQGHGVTIKQEGKITPDPVTGRLKAVFDDAPQQPFETMTVTFNDGPRAPLAIQNACGPMTTTARLSSWAGQSVTSVSAFDVPCRDGLGVFSPLLAAGTATAHAGVASPFNLSIHRPDGQSALSGLAMQLPKGLLANLKGNLGTRVGSATALAGLGAAPFPFHGDVYLEGAYGDAPFSLRVVVPAKAGPYDLGDVVVRQKLYVDPETAQVTVHSDPIPTILQGVPINLQRLDVSIDKPGFMINPTSCEAQRIGGTLAAVTGQSAPVDVHFQVGGCADLPYRPRLDLRVSGELRNGGHPRLDASLITRPGEANQRSAQVTLPLNLALDPQNAKALCEPAQAARNACPAESIVGAASAVSILDVPLEGPVHFVRGERTTSTGRTVATLPTLFVPLRGQGVQVNVRASSDVVDRKLQTTFDDLPDAPIERFDLRIDGGANGILKVTNGDVCRSTSTPKVGQRFTGQNGKRHRATVTLETGCRFGVVRTARKGNRLTVTVRGLTGGRITVSGAGIESNRRSVGAASSVASVGVSLNAASRRALDRGRTLRLKLKTSFKPSAKGGKTVSTTRTVVVKPTRK